ncbi:MAG: threonine/serine dehydratase [Chloroflexota bacterium]|nr:threonine/serine dehydratase [Chloroflexota bacterium]
MTNQQPSIDVAAEVRAAEDRIRPYLLTTPVVPSVGLTAEIGSPVVLKCDNLQHTGSFKARGALSKSLALTSDELGRGIITASTGNHGAAVAHAARIVGADALVVVPDNANPSKLAMIERLGARIQVHGSDSVETEAAARELAEERGMTYISPYNDPQIIGGQGTLGLELLDQVDPLAAVYVAVGGGGLASGVAGIIKALSPATRIIGCSPAASAVMYHSLEAGEILDLPSGLTLSDGTAGGVEPGAITFDILAGVLDDFVTIDEDDIRQAFLDLIEVEHMLVEGSAAMAYAAARAHAGAVEGTTAVILCGGNVGTDRLGEILDA